MATSPVNAWMDEGPGGSIVSPDGWVDEATTHNTQAAPPPAHTLVGDTVGVLGRVGSRMLDNGKAILQTDPGPQSTAERVGAVLGVPPLATRMATSVLQGLTGATQVPAAVKDINASPDAGQAYSNAAADTAGDMLTQAALMKAGEVATDVATNPRAAVTAAGKTAMSMGRSLPVVGKALDLAKNFEAAKANSPALATPPAASLVTADPDVIKSRLNDLLNQPSTDPLDKLRQATPPQGGEAPTPDAEQMKDRLADLSNPTDAATLKARLAEVADPPTDAATLKSRLSEVNSSQEPMKGEAGYVQQAVQEAGPDASVEDVAKRAKELRGQGDQFEQVFGQPLENYRNPDGSFNMRDFLQEVVKPGVEPPAHVISRVFGSDGVKLVQDISGKPIEKWEATGPTKAERAIPKAVQSGAASVKGDPAQYLKLVGADENSILKTPEDTNTVNFFRNKIKNGESFDSPEIHLDENNNIVGADGRHRALAAVQEGQKSIKIAVKRHPFEATQ